MGHYHKLVNLTQHAVVESFDVGSLDKIAEFGHDGRLPAALWLLLSREAWAGDRVAFVGYEGRPWDLPPHVVAETGLDGTAYYAPDLRDDGPLARSVLEDRGICCFEAEPREGWTRWEADPAPVPERAGVDCVALDLDRGEVLDPRGLGDDRDLHLAAAQGGHGGAMTGLVALLAASNRGGSRGGGDLRSRSAVIGSWAGDRIVVVPLAHAAGRRDVTPLVREALQEDGQGDFATAHDGAVTRSHPLWWHRAVAGATDRSLDGRPQHGDVGGA